MADTDTIYVPASIARNEIIFRAGDDMNKVFRIEDPDLDIAFDTSLISDSVFFVKLNTQASNLFYLRQSDHVDVGLADGTLTYYKSVSGNTVTDPSTVTLAMATDDAAHRALLVPGRYAAHLMLTISSKRVTWWRGKVQILDEAEDYPS